MPTTVTISRENKRKLERLKEKRDLDTYDELFEEITGEVDETASTDDMFGSMEFKDKENYRDRNDRIDRYEQTS